MNITRNIQALATIRGKDSSQHTIRVMVSTRQVDRHGSIILPTAFDKHIATYMKNPVVLWSHNQAVPPVGRALSYRTSSEGLELEIQFAVKENPEAARLWALYDGGYLKGFSVGGYIHEAVYPGDKRVSGLPTYAQEALKNREADFVVTVLELLEVSACAIPSNPGAIKLAVARGVIPAAYAAQFQRVPVFTDAQMMFLSVFITEYTRLLLRQRGWK